MEFETFDFTSGQFVDLSGRGLNLPLTPNFNGNINVNYIAPLNKKINLETTFDYVYQSDIFFDVTNDLLQESYGLLNGRFGITSKNLDVFVWAKNLTDENFFSYGGGISGFQAAAFGMPRTYGANLMVKF